MEGGWGVFVSQRHVEKMYICRCGAVWRNGGWLIVVATKEREAMEKDGEEIRALARRIVESDIEKSRALARQAAAGAEQYAVGTVTSHLAQDALDGERGRAEQVGDLHRLLRDAYVAGCQMGTELALAAMIVAAGEPR